MPSDFYNPDIYAEGYIVFVFPFVRSYVCACVHHIREIYVEFSTKLY